MEPEVMSFLADEWRQMHDGRWCALIKPKNRLPYSDGLDKHGYQKTPLPMWPKVRIDLQEYEVAAIDRFASPGWYNLGFGIIIKGEPKGMGVPLNAADNLNHRFNVEVTAPSVVALSDSASDE